MEFSRLWEGIEFEGKQAHAEAVENVFLEQDNTKPLPTTENRSEGHTEALNEMTTSNQVYESLTVYDEQAKQAGFMTLASGEAYSRKLSRSGEVFIFHDDDDTWRVWRGDWGERQPKPYRERDIITGANFERALSRAKNHIEWSEKGRERARA